jgi:uncharacterized protein YndB with AHSA1/START domain
MIDTAASADTRLVLKKTFAATIDRVFKAWTNPVDLKKWWRVMDSWSAPIVEIDLKIGGKYRLGMHDPEKGETHVVVGIFKEIVQNEKLVYTWKWDGQDKSMETLVTVLFHEHGKSTELELIHEKFVDKNMRDHHSHGWEGCLAQLGKLF